MHRVLGLCDEASALCDEALEAGTLPPEHLSRLTEIMARTATIVGLIAASQISDLGPQVGNLLP